MWTNNVMKRVDGSVKYFLSKSREADKLMGEKACEKYRNRADSKGHLRGIL